MNQSLSCIQVMPQVFKKKSLTSLATLVGLMVASSAAVVEASTVNQSLTSRTASTETDTEEPVFIAEKMMKSEASLVYETKGGYRYLKGKTRRLGNGKVTSFAVLDHDNKPFTVGLRFTKSALENLPQNCKTDPIPRQSVWEFCFEGKMNDALVTIFNVPKAASMTNIASLELSWLPYGHAPEKIWDKPQFDMHVNFVEPTGGEDSEQFYTEVPEGGLPEGYMILPGSGFPWDTPAQKGHSHAANPKTSPEFAGGPFTTNFIYITYGGKVIGYEPYVAFDYLKSQNSVQEIPIASPKFYPMAGYYATRMKVGFHPETETYVIALADFKWFEGMK